MIIFTFVFVMLQCISINHFLEIEERPCHMKGLRDIYSSIIINASNKNITLDTHP